MSLLKKALSVAALAANALTIDFDDRTEQVMVIINGNARTIDSESTPVTSDFDPGLFAEANLFIVVFDPGTTDVIDMITVVVTPDITTSTAAYEIVLTSDTEGHLALPAPPPAWCYRRIHHRNRGFPDDLQQPGSVGGRQSRLGLPVCV